LKAGIAHGANLFSTAVVLFVTVLAPFARLIGTLYVLIRLREDVPPRHLPGSSCSLKSCARGR
jgi:hypothetical protein